MLYVRIAELTFVAAPLTSVLCLLDDLFLDGKAVSTNTKLPQDYIEKLASLGNAVLALYWTGAWVLL